jgi:hypothetical protein
MIPLPSKMPQEHTKSRCKTEDSNKELNKNTHIKTPYSTLKCKRT